MKLVVKIFAVFIFVSIIFGTFFLSSFRIEKTGLFEISKGQGSFEIAQNLKTMEFYNHSSVFLFLSLVSGKTNKLQAGNYLLEKNSSILDIVNNFSKGKTLKIEITFPEGLVLKEIEAKIKNEFEKLEKENIGLRQEIDLENFKIIDFKNEFSFLENAPPNQNLEGFLFPDTYKFDININNKNIARIFLINFDKKLTNELKKLLTEKGKSSYETIIMASLLEKEARNFEEKQKIADILWRRLKIKMPLQVDATINFATNKTKENLSLIDLKIDSPYNTYKNYGLPPGPICNPGLESILATLKPIENNYWYYLSNKNGRIIFSKNFEEHKINKLRYLK